MNSSKDLVGCTFRP